MQVKGVVSRSALCNCSLQFKENKEASAKSIAGRFTSLQPEDAGAWFETVVYSKDSALYKNVLEDTMAALQRVSMTEPSLSPCHISCGNPQVGIIKDAVPISELVDERVATMSDTKWEA